jgi:transposase InsO family protein
MDGPVREDPFPVGEDSPSAAARSATESESDLPRARLTGRRHGSPKKREDLQSDNARIPPAQRIVLLDVWDRSGMRAGEFAQMVGVTPHTLYDWRRRFVQHGPAGLMERRQGGRTGSRLPEATQRSILLMKHQHPEWGCERIHDMLMRCEGYGASPGAIARVLKEAGYVVEEVATTPHEEVVRHFERSRPNQLWQSDLFTFLLKRDNRRVYLVVFLDDHSRFITGYGVWGSSGGALVREVLEAAIANHGAPEEVLTDNGPQYMTWRGKSAFTRLLERRGIKHLVARPRHPQTLGKTERFWGTLWKECVEQASFASLDEARKRVGHFIDHYNVQRPHQGIEGLVPADRFFAAAPEVLATLKARVAANALELAQHGTPRKSFYLTGRIGDSGISLHTEGSRVVLTRPDGEREEVDLEAQGRRAEPGDEADLPEPVAPYAPERITAEDDDTGDQP